jgi:hypothetical protein
MYTFTRLGVIRGLIQVQIDGFLVFIVGNLGTRVVGLLIGIFLFIKQRKIPSIFGFILFTMMLIPILVPMFFIQTGKVFEMIQMTFYFLFFAALFAAIGLSYLLNLKSPKIIKILILIVLITLTIPSALSEFPIYYRDFKTSESLSNPYFQMTSFLSLNKNYNATVLEMPPKDTQPTVKSINSWYISTSTGINAFANKSSFLIAQANTGFPEAEKDKRIDFLKKMVIFANSSKDFPVGAKLTEQIRKELYTNVKYIVSSYEIKPLSLIKGTKLVYRNNLYFVYEINSY